MKVQQACCGFDAFLESSSNAEVKTAVFLADIHVEFVVVSALHFLALFLGKKKIGCFQFPY